MRRAASSNGLCSRRVFTFLTKNVPENHTISTEKQRAAACCFSVIFTKASGDPVGLDHKASVARVVAARGEKQQLGGIRRRIGQRPPAHGRRTHIRSQQRCRPPPRSRSAIRRAGRPSPSPRPPARSSSATRRPAAPSAAGYRCRAPGSQRSKAALPAALRGSGRYGLACVSCPFLQP